LSSSKPSKPNSKATALPIQHADIEWKNNVPYSKYFDDVYYSTTNGYQESEYNFQQQSSLKSRWQNHASQQTFTIIETGFGSGLNFFATWKNWRNTEKKPKHLYFISTELYPLKLQHIQHAINDWPELTPFLNEFMDQYPPPTQGFHQRQFSADNLTLLLLFGDATERLTEMTHPADTWFLDGFNPKKNPDLWSSALFQQINRLSKADTNLATYTSSIEVQRKLAAINFDVEKRPGYGKKREMLVATRNLKQPPNSNPNTSNANSTNTTSNTSNTNTNTNTNNARPDHTLSQNSPVKGASIPTAQADKKPWFNIQSPVKSTEKSAVIIGAGIAGMCCAASLAQRGWNVTVLEKNNDCAKEGSGNPWGALYTRFNTYPSPVNQFFQSSFNFSVGYMNALHKQAPLENFWNPCGLLQCAFSDKEEEQLRALAKSGFWPKSLLSYKTPTQASAIAGVKIDRPGLWIPSSGLVSPRGLCQFILKQHPNIQLRCNQHVATLTPIKKKQQDYWQLLDSDSKLISESQIVIIANAHAAHELNPTRYLPVSQIRGQLSYFSCTETSKQLKTIVSYEGYILPSDRLTNNGHSHLLGATFHPKDNHLKLRKKDHQQNLLQLSRVSEDLAEQLGKNNASESLAGRVGFRCQSPDYLPMVGPIPVLDQFIADYAGLRVGKLKKDYPPGTYYPGLYCNVAHGSKGLISAPISAEIITSYIENSPQPLPEKLLHSVHPARFIIRKLKRREY